MKMEKGEILEKVHELTAALNILSMSLLYSFPCVDGDEKTCSTQYAASLVLGDAAAKIDGYAEDLENWTPDATGLQPFSTANPLFNIVGVARHAIATVKTLNPVLEEGEKAALADAEKIVKELESLI